MEISSKGGPHLSGILRGAFAALAMFFLLPIVFAAGAHGLIPHFIVTNFSWSIEYFAIAVPCTLVAAWLLYIAASGRNPFHRVDVVLDEIRRETQVRKQ